MVPSDGHFTDISWYVTSFLRKKLTNSDSNRRQGDEHP
jgi:hypothetical protein